MSTKVGAKTKGWIKNNTTGVLKSFQFNPSGLQYSRSASYVEVSAPGMSYPNTQYVKGDLREFSVELFMYDVPSTGLISDYEEFLNSFLPPETNTKGYSKPPEMTFCFGYFIRKCVLSSLDTSVERFDSEGKAVQARFTLNLRQVSV